MHGESITERNQSEPHSRLRLSFSKVASTPDRPPRERADQCACGTEDRHQLALPGVRPPFIEPNAAIGLAIAMMTIASGPATAPIDANMPPSPPGVGVGRGGGIARQ